MKSSKEFANIAYSCLEDKKAENIKIIDISGISAIGDYFLIANGTNRSQIQALADHVDEAFGKEGLNAKHIEGYDKANWILLDYGDVIIHIFDKESRDYFDLERIWCDGEFIDINDLK